MDEQNHKTSHQEKILACYQRAEKLEQGVFTKKVAFNTTIYPHWIGDTDCFWYMRQTRQGQTYRRVDAKAQTNQPAFNHDALAAALAEASGQHAMADNLPLSDLDMINAPHTIRFSAYGKRWAFTAQNRGCESIDVHPADWKISPNSKQAIFVRDYNLWVRDLASGEERALTLDGEVFRVYAGSATVSGRKEMPVMDALWSPDSSRVLTQVIDTRNVNIGPPLVQHVPLDGSVRPRVLNPERRVAFPGDEHIEAWRILAIDVKDGNVQYADYDALPVVYPPYNGYFTSNRGWWDADNQHGYFIEQQGGGQAIRLVRFDTTTGSTQVLIEEKAELALTLVPVSHLKTLVIPLQNSNELIWYSESSGWAHLYLYELSTGRLKKPITQGDWLVRNVLHFDAEQRELFIQTAGRVKGRNPYYCDICRVNIDSGKLTPIMSTDHEYVACDQRSRISASTPQAMGVSPSGRYFVTTRSRVDEVPESLLADRDGKLLLSLETADISGLPDNWQWPEALMLKAADGTTDIYAVVFRPSDFDPEKAYPVLDCTFGFSAPSGSFTNNHTGNWHYLSAAAYAELGFVVVMINNRGNEGLRDRVFNTYQDPMMPLDPMLPIKCNKEDCIAGIQQLAKKYRYMDIERVGVVDFTSIPQALSGLLVHPDFYKVGVSNNPLADSRLFGAFGLESNDLPEFEELAGNLRGKLLLIAGMLDDVLPVSMTFRVVEALQKANKNFDMLLLPNLGHTSSGYTIRRSWDYVVTHLLGVEPPEDFKVVSAFDS